MLVILAAILIERWWNEHKGHRQPLSEKLLRPAGYSLQLKLEVLNDSFMTWFMGTFLFALGAIGIFPLAPANAATRFVGFIMFTVVSAICSVVAWRKAHQIRDHRRGLIGEQAVAEQLQTLFATGYQIFHDIPGDGKWNIDHVAVGPAGVFAIETKYRTKQPGKNSERDNEAIFDGKGIQFPNCYDTEAIAQAERNARWLANMLSKATGERVAARAVVALPGWWVTLKANSDVKVLSGRQIAGYISKEPAQLAEASIKRISYQLDQRCRDVEY